MITSVVFYIISALLVLSAVMVVTQRVLFVSALYLATVLSLVGALFALLGADFLFAVQILLYVGGIVVIIAFAVMLSSTEQMKAEPQVNHQWIPSLILVLGLLLVTLVSIKKHSFETLRLPGLPTTASIGRLLLGDMILPFEIVSLVLLAALVGAVLFSKKRLEIK